MKGCTDSETMFGLCQSEGLADDPAEAIARMINRVEASRRQKGIKAAFNMTVALSDGEELWAARYGSDGDGPSLYHSASQAALDTASAADGVIESKATIVVSEPLDGCEEHWTAIPARHVLRASGNDVEIWPLP